MNDLSMPQITLRPLESLVPYARNSRTHSPEQIGQIKASLAEFGWTNPVLADDAGIVAGHGRTLAAAELYQHGHQIRFPNGAPIPPGMVPVVDCSGWSEAQRRAYIIADNKLALNAGWDEELLAVEMVDLKDMGFDIDLLGFDETELAELLAVPAPEDLLAEESEDDAPEPPADPVTVPGDLWVCGDHRVLCGDSLSFEHIALLMDGEQADLLLTDPPYNVSYVGKTKDALTIANDEMGDDDFRQFLRDAYSCADSVMKPGAGFYIWHADSEGYNFRGAARDVGWQVRQCLVWAKNALVLGRQDYQWRHEPCLYGWKAGAAHFWIGGRSQTTVLEFDKPARNAEHPTMKPVDLFRLQVENSCPAGGVVLDPFGGSGTTMLACEQSDRAARLMELDPRYVDVIVRRWEGYTGRRAVHAVTGEPFPEADN